MKKIICCSRSANASVPSQTCPKIYSIFNCFKRAILFFSNSSSLHSPSSKLSSENFLFSLFLCGGDPCLRILGEEDSDLMGEADLFPAGDGDTDGEFLLLLGFLYVS